MDALVNFFGGGYNFSVSRTTNDTISTIGILPYTNVLFDSETAFDTGTSIYTVAIDGTYFFCCDWFVISGSTAVVSLIQKRGTTETIIQQSTNGSATFVNALFKATTKSECLVGDEIYAYLESGNVKLAVSNLTSPNAEGTFSGSRISN